MCQLSRGDCVLVYHWSRGDCGLVCQLSCGDCVLVYHWSCIDSAAPAGDQEKLFCDAAGCGRAGELATEPGCQDHFVYSSLPPLLDHRLSVRHNPKGGP